MSEFQKLVPLHDQEFEPQELDQETMLLLTMLFSGDGDRKLLMERDLLGLQQYQILVQRAENLNLKIELSLRIFLQVIAKSLGDQSMYVHSLYHIAHCKYGGDSITLYQFCESYPDGFPSDEYMGKAWDSQKDERHNNRVDDLRQYKV